MAKLNGIYIFGHGKGQQYEFPEEESVRQYLTHDLFDENHGRYRRGALSRHPEIIIFSWGGKAYGHMHVKDVLAASERDIEQYPKARKTFIIESAEVYENPVVLSEIIDKSIHYSPSVSDQQFDEILQQAGKTEIYP